MSLKSRHVCPLCDHDNSKEVPFFDPKSRKLVSRNSEYHWRVCGRCGNAYPSLQPGLAELQAYWDRNRVELDDSSSNAIWNGRKAAERLWADRTYAFVKPYFTENMFRFLDIACGLGGTVKLFQDYGWQAEGVDADPNARRHHEELGISATIGQVESVDTSSGFDLISIAHAIYFVTNPRAFIQRVRTMLAPGGLFLVVLSDLLSSWSDGMPGYAHTWYPTSESLVFVLKQEGFDVVAVQRIKGSIMVLARSTDIAQQPIGYPLKAYFAHATHRIRYALLGMPRRNFVNFVRKLKRAFTG